MSRTTTRSPQNSPEAGQNSESVLSHGLKQRHLSMIALGGVIGAGLFVGSGAGIAAAGPVDRARLRRLRRCSSCW